jgi:hypothetical protein
MGSILFVHGTGVRLKGYMQNLDQAKKVAAANGINDDLIECAWGDPLGVEFNGDSLPGPPDPNKLQQEQEDFARWNWLFDDPLFELDKLTIRDRSGTPPFIPMPGTKPEWERLWDEIASYQPSDELRLLLKRGGLAELWNVSWSGVVHTSPIAREAFEASSHELAEASHALARAVIAQLYVNAVDAGVPGPSRFLRNSLFDRLLVDWKQQVYGLGAFFANMLKRVSTSVLRRYRNSFSNAIAMPIGDILLYQSRGHEVREYIRSRIKGLKPPVSIVAHSLGGIACVDLLSEQNPPNVGHLVTVGSQSPLFYEMGALLTLKPPQPLPPAFPPWLNLYDRNDFLSYVANRLWPNVIDIPIESGQPFPDSHSAYFGNEATWREIRNFISQ